MRMAKRSCILGKYKNQRQDHIAHNEIEEAEGDVVILDHYCCDYCTTTVSVHETFVQLILMPHDLLCA